jgi:hypothetical protein
LRTAHETQQRPLLGALAFLRDRPRERGRSWGIEPRNGVGKLHRESLRRAVLHGEQFRLDGAGWAEAKFYGANGDEYLYYPGRSAANASFSIGGHTDIPIESARLKHVRDGFEDHEWLTVLETHRGREFVLRLISPFITNAWTFADNATALLSARAAVGAAIETALAPPSVPLMSDDDGDDVYA